MESGFRKLGSLNKCDRDHRSRSRRRLVVLPQPAKPPLALDRAAAGRRLDKRIVLLVDLLSSPPSDKTQRAVSEHEHSVQRGSYEPSIRARHKYDQIESELARDRDFRAQWNSIKAHFNVTKFADYKGIIRRRLIAERSMREHWPVRWTNPEIVSVQFSMCFASDGICMECAAIIRCFSSSPRT